MSLEKNKIGRYELLSLIGEGGMGTVYSALLRGPAGFQKKLAVKIIRDNTEEFLEQLRENLINEARVGGMLRHPNIVETFELGEEDGRLFIAMEYIDGVTLCKIMKQWKEIPPQACIDIIGQICLGLSHIHKVSNVSLVHCDIKPSNILIDRYGIIKIADLGLSSSKIHTSKSVRGTPGYMSPEQALGHKVDGRADLFSVGIIFVELLTGDNFFPGLNSWQLVSQTQHVEDIFARRFQEKLENISPHLSNVIQKSLRKDSVDRFKSIKHFLHALREIPKFQGPDLFTLLQERDWLQRSQSLAILSNNSNEHEITRDKVVTDIMINKESYVSSFQTLWAKDQRCITIKGCLGMGKSRLLCTLEAECLEEKIFFVDGKNVSTLVELQQAILTSAKLARLNRVSSEQLIENLIQWGKIFLFIDNTEGFDDSCWQFIHFLWKDLPEIYIVLASQNSVEHFFVHTFELSPLTLQQSMELFCSRIEDRSNQYLAKHKKIWDKALSRACGIPLVIELLASQYCLDPDQIINLDDIWSEGPLQIAFQMSYSGLPQPVKECLAYLSLYQSPFSLLEAHRMLSSLQGWVGDHFEELVRTSLLQVVPSEFAEEPYFIVPWGMRTLIREQVNTDTLLMTQRSFANSTAQWFDNTMLSNFPDYFTFERAKIFNLPNFISAIRYSIQSSDQKALIKNVLSASQVFTLVGPYSRGIAIISRYCSNISSSPMCGHAELWKGILYWKNGEDVLAEKSLFVGLEIFKQRNDSEGQYLALCYLIFVQTNLGKQDSVLQGKNSLEGYSVDISHKALKHRALGYHYTQIGDVQKAIEHLRIALQIFWSLGNNREVIAVLTSMGVIYYRSQNMDAAAKNYRKAIAIGEESGLVEGLESSWMNLALIEIMFGNITAALSLFEKAEKRYVLLGNYQAMALLYANWALLCLLQGLTKSVISYLHQSYRFVQKRDYPIASHTFHLVMGLFYLQSEENDNARKSFKKALSIVNKYSLTYKNAETFALYGESLLQCNQISAFKSQQAALQLEKKSPLFAYWNSFMSTCECLYYQQQIPASVHLQEMTTFIQQSTYPKRPDLCYQIERLQKKIRGT
jgi:serine/threonine protein kinase/Tfp pilus assembly protein PilF